MPKIGSLLTNSFNYYIIVLSKLFGRIQGIKGVVTENEKMTVLFGRITELNDQMPAKSQYVPENKPKPYVQ